MSENGRTKEFLPFLRPTFLFSDAADLPRLTLRVADIHGFDSRKNTNR